VSTRERRQREIEGRERLFLHKAQDLVARDGLLNLQMCRVAESCEYSVGTLYQHFASKEDLLVALLTERVGERAELFRCAAAWEASPRDRMFAIAAADRIFVQRHPEHFRVAQFATTEVVWGAASEGRRQAYLRAQRPLGEIVFSIVQEAIESGDLALVEDTAEEAAISLWTLVTGTHHLVHAHGVLESYSVHDPYRLMGRSVHRLLNGWGWRPLFDFEQPGRYGAYLERLREEVFGELV
jgi:AcrR family transcriptional regulator